MANFEWRNDSSIKFGLIRCFMLHAKISMPWFSFIAASFHLFREAEDIFSVVLFLFPKFHHSYHSRGNHTFLYSLYCKLAQWPRWVKYNNVFKKHGSTIKCSCMCHSKPCLKGLLRNTWQCEHIDLNRAESRLF